jgi:hypothetical protein
MRKKAEGERRKMNEMEQTEQMGNSLTVAEYQRSSKNIEEDRRSEDSRRHLKKIDERI